MITVDCQQTLGHMQPYPSPSYPDSASHFPAIIILLFVQCTYKVQPVSSSTYLVLVCSEYEKSVHFFVAV